LIYFLKIPFAWDDRRLRDKFRQAGSIDSVELKAKGNALIKFFSPDDAKKAVGK
jgi:hypothetical protein